MFVHVIIYGTQNVIGLQCEDLDDPRNGNVKLTGTTVGSKATYVCDYGFILRGNQLRKCLSNGRWSGSEPFCKGNMREIDATLL